MVTCSLVISTYNWPAALELCLKSILTQTLLPGEIIIGDDGSTPETAAVINDFKNSVSIPVIHVWQEDQGFRLARSRNKCFAIASGAYIIQIDGDIILNDRFIADHVNFSRPDYFASGSRVLLSPQTTKNLLGQKSIDIKKHSVNNKNLFNGWHSRFLQGMLAQNYKSRGRYKYYVKGCNMAFWKKDLIAVNGYNEDFTGWGKEDSELAIRLMNAGIQKRFLKFGGICYHLFHKEAPRKMEQKNTEMMFETQKNKVIRAAKGMIND
jgi:glycosyltransferase involved in cell wall biosynthesis